MADDGGARDAWVKRVLGISPPAGQSGTGKIDAGKIDAGRIVARWRAARRAWQDASETVDAQINGLARILRANGDDDLRQIAESGLMTVTGGFRTRMTAALMDLGDGDIEKLRKNGAKAAGFAEKLRDQIDGDIRVAACDENDFGAPVAIRATLGPALAELAGVLRDAAQL